MTSEESREACHRPGKFEASQPWAGYLWDLGLDGLADDDIIVGGRPYYVFRCFPIGDPLLEAFPELKGFYAVSLWEDEQGFVYTDEWEGEADFKEAFEIE